MMQFPQPTRPINSYDLESLHIPQEPSQSQPMNMDICESRLPGETRFDPIPSHDNCQTSTEEREQEQGEIAQETLDLIKELYAKLPESVRSQVNLDKLNVADKLKDVKVDKTIMRGINGPVDELKQKLERFKIKTVQPGEVVKEEEADKSKAR